MPYLIYGQVTDLKVLIELLTMQKVCSRSIITQGNIK